MVFTQYLEEQQILEHKVTENKIFKEALLHLDFKGAPPTYPFLLEYIKFLGQNYKGVITGLLLEWEDTFPYEGYLEPIRGQNVYTRL